MANKIFKRPCTKCGETYRPTGKYQKLCDDCRYSKNKTQLEKSYFKSKEELDNLRDNITLKKWKILSKTYKIGKKIWGNSFTRERLSFDMDMPITTVLRCLSLDRANKKSWELVEEGKISVFKLAMVCFSKNKTYQDEVINMVIEDKLSTLQIISLRINNIKDVNIERHRLAAENGYSRKSSAYANFRSWAERGTIFLLMDKSHLPENKIKDIKSRLKKLKKDIGLYLQ